MTEIWSARDGQIHSKIVRDAFSTELVSGLDAHLPIGWAWGTTPHSLVIHERGVEDIGARVDMNRDDIASLREEVTDLNRRLGPTNPDELTPGEIAAERRDWNRVTREINRLQGQLNRDLGTLETRQARAKPYFDRRKEIAADAKNQLERDLGGRFARYENAKERSAGIDRELKTGRAIGIHSEQRFRHFVLRRKASVR